MRIRFNPTVIVLLALLALLAGCKGETKQAEAEPFSFVVYPNSRYLGQLTDMHKSAHRFIDPNGEVPPTAVYDTEASFDEVVKFYANEYGYELAAQPPATPEKEPKGGYYRSGDLAADVKAIEPILKQMNLNTDVTKASGAYRAAELAAKPSRPRVTIQRPYFDVTKSEVVDRTFILMSK